MYTLTWICGFYRTFESRGIRIAIPMSKTSPFGIGIHFGSRLEKTNANNNQTSKNLVDLLQKENPFLSKEDLSLSFSHNDNDQKSAENEAYRYALVSLNT